MRNCTCPWAFIVIQMEENAILRDLRQNKNNPVPIPQWLIDAANLSGGLDLSEQYLLENAFGNQNFCDGGHPITAAQYVCDKFINAELENDFPYQAKSVYNYEIRRRNGTSLRSKKPTNYIPFQPFDLQQGLGIAQTPFYLIHQHQRQSFTSDAVNMIRKHISRGFVIPIAIQPTNKFLILNDSSESIPHEDCILDGTQYDLSASIIGYGFKGGIPVWIVTYPLGKNWGRNGRIFLEIGKNSYCSEMYAYGWISKYYAHGEPLEKLSVKRD